MRHLDGKDPRRLASCSRMLREASLQHVHNVGASQFAAG